MRRPSGVASCCERLAQHRGNDLGVGGDLRRNRQATLRDQVGVVVNITVEHSGHVTAVTRSSPGIERVGIGNRDDADAGPASVAHHHHLSAVDAQGPAQQAVLADLRPQRRGVVAQLTDFRGGLVHECEPIGGVPQRAGAEERIFQSHSVRARSGALGIRIEARPPHEHLQAGRIPASHLEPVKGGQRHLDRPEPADGGRRRRATPQPDKLPGHPQAIAS